MSQSGIQHTLTETLGGTDRLLVFYDFSGMSTRSIGTINVAGGNFDSVIENCDPAVNTGVYSGVLLGTTKSSPSTSRGKAVEFLANDQLSLFNTNVHVTGTNNIPYSNTASILDFEFDKEVGDGVLFGSLEKTSSVVNGETITGARGYNVGLTDRGHIFYQGFDNNGDFIHTANSIELSERNIISFSVGNNSLTLARFDYLNNKIQQETFGLNNSFIANNSGFFLGGTKQYFRGTNDGEFRTARNIKLNSFSLFSGFLPASALFSIGSGVVGDYFEDTQAAVTRKELTGYNQTVVYKTGITGYDYENTSSINISTGRYMLTGSYFGASSVNTGEGDRYFIYRSFDDALSDSGVKTFVKEEVGALYGAEGSGYQYTPTGDTRAFDTLGLRDIDVAVNEYVEQRGLSGAATVAVKLYESRFITGVTSGISGVKQVPAYRTVVERPALPQSGVRMGGNADLLKKNFIFFINERVSGAL